MRVLSVALVLSCLSFLRPARADELDALGKTIDAHPEESKGYDAYAAAAFKAKRFDEAIRRLKVAVARIPDYTEGYYKLAFAYRQKKEWADAADYYRRYLSLNPTKTDPYFGLGAALEGLGDANGALTAYSKYVSLEKSPGKQRFIELAKAEIAKLDPSRAPPPLPVGAQPPPAVATSLPPSSSVQAAPAPNPVAPASPGRGNGAQLKADAEELRKAGKLEEALIAYRKAIDADRGNVELYNELGNIYFALKKYGDSVQAFREATGRDPRFALAWYNLAHALRKGDQKTEAVRAYREYIHLKPEDPDPYYGLGQTLKAMGDVAGAVDAFRKYVAMEKRPEEQRWVDKARAELEVLEAMQRSSNPGTPPPSGPSGKIDDREGPGTLQSSSETIDREIARDRLLPMSRDGIVDPFGDRLGHGDLIDPFGRESYADIRDPFAEAPSEKGTASSISQARLKEYGAALLAYRRALFRHAEDVGQRYEQGISFALSADGKSAARIWNGVLLADPRVDAARKSVERVRALVAHR